jgi:hypothetical protein
VIDFGISVTGEASALTRTGVAVGTQGFMSPEQLTGEPVGPASDVFSLGAVLAFTATGAGPFGTGSAHALSFRVVHEEPGLRRLPPDLRALVAECLAKEPGGRPTVPTLLDRLARATGDASSVKPAPSQAGWLPEPVVAAVHTRIATQPSPEPSARAAPSRPGEWPDGDRPPSADAAGGPAGPTRRRALLGVGAGVAGLGFGGWSIYDSRSSATRRREAGSGERRWRFRVGGLVYALPAVADGLVYISSSRARADRVRGRLAGGGRVDERCEARSSPPR